MTHDTDRRVRLAYAIRAAMWERDLTNPEVARKVGRNAATVRRWMKGETVPSMLDLEPLAEALGVEVEYLASPPPVPDYPLSEYLVDRVAREAVTEALEAGSRDRRRPRREPEA